MSKLIGHEEKIAGLKVVGAGTASTVATVAEAKSHIYFIFMHWTIAEWTQFFALLVVIAQFGLLLPKYVRMYKRWRAGEPLHQRHDDKSIPK